MPDTDNCERPPADNMSAQPKATTSAPPPNTYRMCGIPAGIHLSTLADFIDGNIDVLQPGHNIRVRSLAKSPNDHHLKPSQTATLEFVALPKVLHDKSKFTWEFPVRGFSQPILLDLTFSAFTPLNDVSEHEHELDCIAISGLASHPFGSWRERGRSDGSTYMWLRDTLSCDMPRCRVMTYGYTTELSNSTSFQTIDDLAIDFIQYLQAIGKGLPSAKPTVILAHSLGGIVAKAALLLMASGDHIRQFMLNTVRLVIFFGVPNKGMHINHLLPMVHEQPNQQLVKALSKDSIYLRQLDERFRGISQYRDMRLVWAYETETSPTVVLSSGRWSASGPLEVLVEKASAVPDEHCEKFPISRNHSEMVKFSRHEPKYSIVRDHICKVLQNKPGRQTSTYSGDLASRNPSNSGEHYRSNDQTNSTRDPDEVLQSLEKSMDFLDREYRQSTIESISETSYGWVMTKKGLGFSNWLINGNGLYWIRGKPGSGKSTLMKHLYDSTEVRELIQAQQRQRVTDLWFFFNDRGIYLQKSMEGLLRSITLQILKKCKVSHRTVLGKYCDGINQIPTQWSIGELQELLFDILESTGSQMSFLLFVDALDEFNGFPEAISGLLELLLDKFAANLKICVSSRPWDAFYKCFSRSPGFELHQHTGDLIERFIQLRVRQISANNERYAALIQHQEQAELYLHISRALAQRAEGVFLWLKLALQRLEKAAPFVSVQAVDSLITELPDDLEEFYVETLERLFKLDSLTRPRVFALLETLLRSQYLLSPQRLAAIVVCAYPQSYSECVVALKHHSNGVPQSQDASDDLFLNHCGGLIETVRTDYMPATDLRYEARRENVQFIHRTVRDFVASPRFALIVWERQPPLQSLNGYSFLFKCAMATSATVEDRHNMAYLDETSTGRHLGHFLESCPPQTFQQAVQASNTAFKFATIAGLKIYLQSVYTNADHTNRSALLAQKPLLVIAEYLGGELYFEDISEPNTNARFAAVIDVWKLLMTWGASLETDRSDFSAFELLHTFHRTPFTLVRDSSQHAAYEVLLRAVLPSFIHAGQDLDAQLRTTIGAKGLPYFSVRSDKCAFMHSMPAIHLVYVRAVDILLKNGADPNALAENGFTCIDWCVHLVSGETFLSSWDTGQIYDKVAFLSQHGGRLSSKGAKLRDKYVSDRNSSVRFTKLFATLEVLPNASKNSERKPIVGLPASSNHVATYVRRFKQKLNGKSKSP